MLIFTALVITPALASQPRACAGHGDLPFRAALHDLPQSQGSSGRSRGLPKLGKCPGNVLVAITKGGTHANLPDVTGHEDKRMIADISVGARLTLEQIADAKLMPGNVQAIRRSIPCSASRCGTGEGDASNARFQPAKATGLSASQVRI